jgi:hypothetical protein
MDARNASLTSARAAARSKDAVGRRASAAGTNSVGLGDGEGEDDGNGNGVGATSGDVALADGTRDRGVTTDDLAEEHPADSTSTTATAPIPRFMWAMLADGLDPLDGHCLRIARTRRFDR